MFKRAIPVFAEGKENALNYHLVLHAEAESLKDTTLYISAFSFYRLSVNGRFVSFGPARAAKGYARVDELSLDWCDSADGKNDIVIEVAGYNCSSLSTARQTSFVVAELRREDEVLLYTGRDFCGYRSAKMMQKVERYSAQRHFGEIHNYTFDGILGEKVNLTETTNRPKYLERKAPVPTYDTVHMDGCSSFGEFNFDDTIPYRKKRSSFEITEEWGCFADGEIFSKPYRWIQRQVLDKKGDDRDFPLRMKRGDYVIVDLGRIETGFLTVNMTAHAHSEVVLGFSEACFEADFEFTNINSQNVIEYFVEEGMSVSAESFEPYTCRFAIIMVRNGAVTLEGYSVRTLEYPMWDIIERSYKDPELRAIYRAAERTFAHNAVDIYTDCPSRERAGWLCDSFFTGRAEYFLTGKTLVEDAFLENYRLFENDGSLPEGAIPMCYPSDFHDNNKFIPQWAMWYVLEVKEYLTERNTAVDKELFKKSVMGIVKFLERYENKDGLLQNLPSWNFVEWSTANEWVHDVNYPTNFLYAEVLRSAYALYGDESLLKKAERVAAVTAERSFDGEVFIDNAVLTDGVLVNTRNSSEAGQYYAILFGDFDINDEKYAKLKAHICNGFAELDISDRGYVPVNAFIGFYVKMCAMMKLGWFDMLEDDIKSFFGGMEEATGTLWEYRYTQRKGSYDHGFASFVAIAIGEIEKDKK